MTQLCAKFFSSSLMGVCAIGMTITGCSKNMDGEPVDYGPPQDVESIASAVGNLVRDSDPAKTKVGAFGRFLTTAEVGGGALSILTTNTSQEVTSSTLQGDILTLNLLEKTTEYRGDTNTSEKMTRNFELSFRVTPTPTPTPPLILPTAQNTLTAQLSHGTLDASVRAFLVQNGRRKFASEDSPKMTYHHLRTWEDIAPPPPRVQAQANCLGIPGCKIRLRHVVFNIVTWDEPGGNLIRVELVTSPDVPQTLGFNMNQIWRYVPGLMKSCLTRLVPIGDDERNWTLVHECKTVVNFAFDKASIAEATP